MLAYFFAGKLRQVIRNSVPGGQVFNKNVLVGFQAGVAIEKSGGKFNDVAVVGCLWREAATLSAEGDPVSGG